MPRLAPRVCNHPGCFELAYRPNAFCEDHEGDATPKKNWWSQLYDNPRWKKASRLFRKRNRVCVECGRPAQVTDHIVPHRGDQELFWDQENWQPLCRKCHTRKSYGEGRFLPEGRG